MLTLWTASNTYPNADYLIVAAIRLSETFVYAPLHDKVVFNEMNSIMLMQTAADALTPALFCVFVRVFSRHLLAEKHNPNVFAVPRNVYHKNGGNVSRSSHETGTPRSTRD